jgi:hypothetical protein
MMEYDWEVMEDEVMEDDLQIIDDLKRKTWK